MSNRLRDVILLALLMSVPLVATPTSAPSLAAFSLRLFSRLARDPDTFISPPSVASALLLAALGATPGSSTERQFELVLGGPARKLAEAALPGPAPSDAGVTLQLANSAWLASSILPAYRADVERTLAAAVFALPTSPAPVNAWVRNATRGEISKLFDAINPNTRALLVSAVFFSGRWSMRFEPANTINAPFFTNASGLPNVVRMMTMRNKYFMVGGASIGLGRSVNLIDLPYGNLTYTATVVLPDKGVPLNDVVHRLSDDGAVGEWDKWISSMTAQRLALLQLPRFRLEYGAKSLNEVLKGMGLQDAFNRDITNQFRGMSSDPLLYISDLVHKATVEVTEEGTTASAATGVVVTTRSARPDIQFVVDRPFLFVIRNRHTEEILFVGRVDNPKSSSESEGNATKQQEP